MGDRGQVVDLGSPPSSPEDAGTFKRSLQIDNKGLVGDAVGNVSRLRRLFHMLLLTFP